jgi:hypothetical protein
MDENQVQATQQAQQTQQTQQVSNPQPSQPVTDQAPQTEQNGQNFFGGDQPINYDESSAFEPVNGKVEEENYDFQDFSPFDVDEEEIDSALVGDDDVEEVAPQENLEVVQEVQEMAPETQENTSEVQETTPEEKIDTPFVNDSIETEEESDFNKNPEILEKFSNVYGLTKKILSISDDSTSFAFS